MGAQLLNVGFHETRMSLQGRKQASTKPRLPAGQSRGQRPKSPLFPSPKHQLRHHHLPRLALAAVQVFRRGVAFAPGYQGVNAGAEAFAGGWGEASGELADALAVRGEQGVAACFVDQTQRVADF